jgi:hypothetical protein
MSQKVVITNLAEDKEGSHFVYILRRMVSKKQAPEERREREHNNRTNHPKNKGPR